MDGGGCHLPQAGHFGLQGRGYGAGAPGRPQPQPPAAPGGLRPPQVLLRQQRHAGPRHGQPQGVPRPHPHPNPQQQLLLLPGRQRQPQPRQGRWPGLKAVGHGAGVGAVKGGAPREVAGDGAGAKGGEGRGAGSADDGLRPGGGRACRQVVSGVGLCMRGAGVVSAAKGWGTADDLGTLKDVPKCQQPDALIVVPPLLLRIATFNRS